MAIKETPTNFRVYYKSMRTKYTALKEEALVSKDNLEVDIKNLNNNVAGYVNYIKDTLSISDYTCLRNQELVHDINIIFL